MNVAAAPHAWRVALQRRVYPAQCNYPLHCPFVIHPCTPIDPKKADCWNVNGLRPGRVSDSYCGLEWDRSRFSAAFAGQTIIFIGDSMAEQQWRILLCLEASQLLPAAFVPHHGLVGTASVDVKSGRLRCAETVTGARLCHTKQWSLEPVLSTASSFASDPNATLILSAFAHTANVTESEMLARVAQWKRAASPVRATIVWRTRGYDHYGGHGYAGRQERYRTECSAVSAFQRERQGEVGLGRKRLEQALRDVGVRVLDADPSTEGAHGAHPLVCASGHPTSGVGVSFHDCRHFCLPGPVDLWNAALLEGHVPPFDTSAFMRSLQRSAAEAAAAKAAKVAAATAATGALRREEEARRRRAAQDAADAASRQRLRIAGQRELLSARQKRAQLLKAACVGFLATVGIGALALAHLAFRSRARSGGTPKS